MGAVASTLREAYFGLRSLVTLISNANADFSAATIRVLEPRLPSALSTESFWQQNPVLADLVHVKSTVLPSSADIVIIGTGIAGASVAYTILNECQNMGIQNRVVILEARQLCSGATGRNGGHIKATPYHAYSTYKARFGKSQAKKFCEFQLMHLPTLLEIAKHEGLVDAEVREVETLDVFTDSSMWQKARGMVKELSEDMPAMAEDVSIYDAATAQQVSYYVITIWLSISLIDAQKFGIGERCVGAISYGAGAMWPYRFVTSLYDRLLEKYGANFSIETETVVEHVEVAEAPSRQQYLLTTSRGPIAASQVIHATDAFAANLVPGLKGKIFPVRGHVTAQRPGRLFPNHDGLKSWSFVHRSGYDYITQRPRDRDTHTASGAEIIVGGGMVQSPAQGLDEFGVWTDAQTSFPIASYLSGILSVAFSPKTWGGDGPETRVKALWSGCMGYTTDLMPLVGPLESTLTGRKQQSSDHSSGEWIVAAFGGEGMVHAWLAGVAVGLMIVGREDIDSKGSRGRPAGRVRDWLPEQMRCSKKRLDSSSLSQLATMM